MGHITHLNIDTQTVTEKIDKLTVLHCNNMCTVILISQTITVYLKKTNN